MFHSSCCEDVDLQKGKISDGGQREGYGEHMGKTRCCLDQSGSTRERHKGIAIYLKEELKGTAAGLYVADVCVGAGVGGE